LTSGNFGEEFFIAYGFITMKAYIRRLLLLAVLCATAHSIHATNIVWTNTAGGNWSVAANWSPNQVPDASDTAIITTDGDYTVTLDISAAVNGLVLGTTSGSSTQTFLVDGQTFTLGGQAAVNSGGQFHLSGGPITFSGILTNYGTVRWGNTDLHGEDNPQIFNFGLWEATTNNTFYGGDSGGTTTFNNHGTVVCQVGQLSIGGSYTLAGGALNFGINSSNNFGSFYLDGEAALDGTLSVNFTNGYSPTAGDAFPLVSYGSETGIFTVLNLPHLAPGLM
jgi:hypothetical protein